MENNEIINVYNQFNRIQNKFDLLKRKPSDGHCDSLYPAEMQVLCVLYANPEFTITEIASQLYITKSAASQLVKKLYTKEMLQKYRSHNNERVVVLSITEKGKTILDNFFQNETLMFGEMIKEFSSISEDQMNTIKFFLDKVEKMLDKKMQ